MRAAAGTWGTWPSRHSAKAYINNRKVDEVVVVDMRRFEIVRRIKTSPSGEAQAMVLNRHYGVFERVVRPQLV